MLILKCQKKEGATEIWKYCKFRSKIEYSSVTFRNYGTLCQLKCQNSKCLNGKMLRNKSWGYKGRLQKKINSKKKGFVRKGGEGSEKDQIGNS